MTKPVSVLAALLLLLTSWAAAAAAGRRLALPQPVPVLRHGDRLNFLASCQPGSDSVRLQATARYRRGAAAVTLLDLTVDCPAPASAGAVTLRLPRRHRCYRHAALLSGAYFPAGVKLRLWLAPKAAAAAAAAKFETATVRLVTETALPEYWELPAQCRREEASDWDADDDAALAAGVCSSWGCRIVLERREWLADRTCRAETERYHIHDYPMAVQDDIGVLTHLQPIKEVELLRHWASKVSGGSGGVGGGSGTPCQASWCNVLLGIDNDDNHRSPGLLVTNQNRIHYQGHLSRRDGHKASAFLSTYQLPMRTWIRIVVVWQPHKIQIGVFDTRDKEMFNPIVHSWSQQVHYADSELALLLGGYHLTPSINGYIAQTVLFRGRALLPLARAVRSVSAPAFLVRSGWLRPRLGGYCRSLHRRLEALVLRRRRAVESRDTCQSWGAALERLRQQPRTFAGGPVCAATAGDADGDDPAGLPDSGRGRRWAEQVMEQRLKALPLAAGDGGHRRLSDSARRELGQQAYQLALKLMQAKHFDAVDQSAALLNASACMGHCSARFLLSALLSYGLQSDRWMDFTESNALLLENVLHCRHQLSLLALATKHYLGSDGVETNRELSLAYFLHLARRTPAEKDELGSEDYNRVDMVRLTDEQKVQEVTHAEDDLFHWISHQAGQGVPWARRKMADLLYWGSNGIQRNVQKGLGYFKQAADEDQSPSAAHDYGTLLIKGGHGPERVQEGLRYLQRAASLAADQPDPRTLTSLGWYAERHEGDMAKAIGLYRRAAALGSQDAVYNLGVLHDIGYPQYGLPRSRGEAFRYFMQAAGHGLLHASIMVSSYRRRHMPLTGLPRDLAQATEWARYVAELNPKVGALLTKAVVAYRKDQVETSALWYTLAAYCGLEVANFNLAFLCDQRADRLAHRFAKECQFHHYNRSVMRDENQVHAKSLTRMGDYYSSELAHIRNLTASVDLYMRAARKGDPEAVYNLAYLVETGLLEPSQAAAGLSIELDSGGGGGWQLMQRETRAAVQIYKLCEKMSKTETDLPCRLARYRLKIGTYLLHYFDALKATLIASLLVLLAWRYVCSSQ